MQKLKPSEIKTNGGTQGRVSIEQELIDEYAGYLRAGVKLPAIIVYKDSDGVYWLVDGFHRLYAWLVVSPDKAIECDVREGSQSEAIWFSCTDINDKNGKRRTNADKEKAVKTALAHKKAVGLSDGEIGDHCGVGHTMVAKYRNENATLLGVKSEAAAARPRRGRDGRTINTANIGRRRGKIGKGKGLTPMVPVLEEGRISTPLDSYRYKAEAEALGAEIIQRESPEFVATLVAYLTKHAPRVS